MNLGLIAICDTVRIFCRYAVVIIHTFHHPEYF
jgi:hypothetical protein